MKKKLEAELISIAHRILKIKDKSDIVTLHHEAQKLYEKLSVLRFVEENFSGVRPTIGRAEVEGKFDSGFDYSDAEVAADNNKTEVQIPEIKLDQAPLIAEEASVDAVEEEVSPNADADTEAASTNVESSEETIENDEEKESPEEPIEQPEEPKAPEPVEEPEMAKEEVFIPSFQISFEAKEEVTETPKASTPQFSFDDLLGKDYADPIFVKPEELSPEKVATEDVVAPIENKLESESIFVSQNDKEKRPFSVNDRLSKGITIGLNDRIAFMKHLFANSSEDYNRVLSQLITFDTFEDAQSFIDDMVKPDYNNWEGKEEYSARFIEIIERRFS